MAEACQSFALGQGLQLRNAEIPGGITLDDKTKNSRAESIRKSAKRSSRCGTVGLSSTQTTAFRCCLLSHTVSAHDWRFSDGWVEYIVHENRVASNTRRSSSYGVS